MTTLWGRKPLPLHISVTLRGVSHLAPHLPIPVPHECSYRNKDLQQLENRYGVPMQGKPKRRVPSHCCAEGIETGPCRTPSNGIDILAHQIKRILHIVSCEP